MLQKIHNFTKKVLKAAFERVRTFVVGVYQHAEAVVILTLSALGLNILLSEIPFVVAVPVFIEAALVIPVISVLLISLLVRSSALRANKRSIKIAA